MLYTLGGGVVGEMERYTTTKKLVSSYRMFLHQGSEEYTAFLLKLDADREKA
ncbi:Phi92_gp215 [Escherichia phage phi92]|uniref:Phi92_gp215 n=1 Tax=Escherichia phage phi92 TaxID=948870 RepID=I7I039_9CAUD|nr:Phi92_gp215 [Escherichia phage phi92]CBY99644.1 Phi92_gp215 [Escherichia phage phi92]